MRTAAPPASWYAHIELLMTFTVPGITSEMSVVEHEQRAEADVHEHEHCDRHERLRDRRGAEHRGAPVVVEVGELTGRRREPAVGAPHLAERLHNGDAVGELDRGLRDRAEPRIHLGRLLTHAAHLRHLNAEVDRHHRDRDEPEAPVDDERRHGERERRHDGRHRLDRGVRDERVERLRVVLHRLADASRGRLREPGERRVRDALDEALPQDAREPQVAEVRYEQREKQAAELREERADEQHRDAAHLVGVGCGASRRGAEQQVAKPHEREVRRDREDARGGGEDAPGEQVPADGRQQPLECVAAIGCGFGWACGPRRIGHVGCLTLSL
jgi:hypothetical protein